MKTETKNVAYFLSAAIWADGDFSEAEHQCLSNIAKDYEMPALEADVESVLSEISTLSGSALTERLAALVPQVDSEEKDGIIALCLQLMGCDNYLAEEEISNFYAIANILGIGEDRAQLLLSELTSDDEALVE